MNTVLENLSIVILAKDFNLSIFKPFWLIKNNIFREQELQGNIVITPPAVQIPAQNFQLTVLPDRLQMLIPRRYAKAEADISRIIGGIVKTLPHTPYTAVGLNFNYFAAPQQESSFSSWNRKLLASGLSTKLQSPADENARFGSYVSFDALATRLRIDIKPIKAPNNIENLCNSWHAGQDLIRLNLNFHSDVFNADSPSDSVLATVDKWPDALALSQKLTKIISD